MNPIPTVDTSNYSPYFHIEKFNTTGAWGTYDNVAIRFRSNNASYTARVRNQSILLINLDNMQNHYYHAPATATTTSNTFVTGGSTTFSIANTGNIHLLIGSAMLNSGSTSVSADARLAQGGIGTVRRECNTTTEEYPMVAFKLMPGTTSTYNWEFLSESTNTSTLSNQRIFLLDTGIPNAENPF
jgi:hypothetical protein